MVPRRKQLQLQIAPALPARIEFRVTTPQSLVQAIKHHTDRRSLPTRRLTDPFNQELTPLLFGARAIKKLNSTQLVHEQKKIESQLMYESGLITVEEDANVQCPEIVDETETEDGNAGSRSAGLPAGFAALSPVRASATVAAGLAAAAAASRAAAAGL